MNPIETAINFIKTTILSIVLSTVFGITTSFAASLSLISGKWVLASIPGDSGNHPIADIFAGDSLPEEDYSNTWVVFAFDPLTGEYSEVPIDGSVSTGMGFWMQHATGVDVNVELPVIPMPALSQPGAGCTDATGCYVSNLQS